MGSDELVYIQTDILTVTIKGSASHPAFPGVEFKDRESMLLVSCDEPYEIIMAGDPETVTVQNLNGASSGTYKIRPLFFEQQRYEVIIESGDDHKVEFWHENFSIRKSITPVGKKSNILSGVINFGNDIGMSDLIIIVDNRRYLKLTVEVFPSKIGYKDDYKTIVADVTAEIYNLIFDFLKKTYYSFDISQNRQSSPVEFFTIIRRIYKRFLNAADIIIANPNHVLESQHVILPNHKVKRTDNKTVRWIEKHPDLTIKSGNRIMAERALAVNRYVTYDTEENRMTKYMLENTVKHLASFRIQYLKLSRDADPALVHQIDIMIKNIQCRYNTGFLKNVLAVPSHTDMSLVFCMAPGYRDLYRCYLLLQHGLSVSGSIFNISVKDLPVLYEYWCFIKLNSLLKDRYKLLSQDIIKVAGKGLFVSLVKGQRSRVRYLNPKNGEVITLSYNPKEISGATVPQKPDNVLSLNKKGADINYEYVFDAKYKLNPALEGSLYQKMYKTPGPQEEDINTMHRYRDAIVYQNNASPYERMMFGAYILFPYKNQEEYRSHRFYQSISQVNIGGLPFLPIATSMVNDMLDELISDSPESAFERATLPTGIEDRLTKVDWSSRDVLIGTPKSNAMLDTFMSENVYFIPASMIKDDNLPIHYVALFQTPRIFSNNAGIYYYGEVLRTVLDIGKNINVIPKSCRNPDDFYYCFHIKDWVQLRRPILPKESGFTFEFTNMFLIEHAEYVPELLLRSEEEYRFYTELKRHTGAALNNNEISTGFELGEIKVLFDEDKIQMYVRDKIAGDCSISEFSRYPNATFRQLQRCITSFNESLSNGE